MTVYLDHASTSPLRPEVRTAMEAAPYGNPSGSHHIARAARQALDDAREVIATLLGAEPGGVVFTSGGTEADNLACAHREVAVCSAVEHAAILSSCVGVRAPVDATGTVDLDRFKAMLGPETTFVSVMTANNEVGTIQPIAAIAEIIHRCSPHATFHTDAVQAPFLAQDADMLSISGHKLGGPKGIGALVIRRGDVTPILHGGGQERERRSGTQWVAGAVGLAAALAASKADVGAMRDRLADGLVENGAIETVPRGLVLPGHCHVRFPGIEPEELIFLLDEEGICASAGAACASGATEPSHVLAAMGLPNDGIRFSLGHTTSNADISSALVAVPTAFARLR